MKNTILYHFVNLMILVQILSFTSCQKSEYIYLSSEFKSFVVFPEGSYWIYEEILSGFSDTLIVEKLLIDTRPEHTESNIYVESGSIQYQTKSSGKIIGLISTSSTSNECSSMSSILIYNSKNEPLNPINNMFLDVGNQFFCCCDSGTLNRFDPIIEYSGTIDSISIGESSFYNIRIFTNIIEDSLFIEQNPGLVKKSFFSRNVGLIKWEQFNGNVWELKEYKIN